MFLLGWPPIHSSGIMAHGEELGRLRFKPQRDVTFELVAEPLGGSVFSMCKVRLTVAIMGVFVKSGNTVY